VIENNKNNEEYRFIILLSEKINKKSESLIATLQSKYRKNRAVIEYREVEEFLRGAVVHNGYINSSTYLRLFIPWILEECDVCLFLDSDVCVNLDICKLWKMDISDYYYAGVYDYEIMRDESSRRIVANRLGLNSVEYYYAGVTIMNLKKIRECKGMREIFTSDMQSGYSNEDQDIINKHFQGKILKIPLKYNMLNRFLTAQSSLDKSIYTDDEIQETMNGEVVIHYVGKNKPWKWSRCKGAEIWYFYAKKILSKNEYLDLVREGNKDPDCGGDWYKLRENCTRYDDIVIWGNTDSRWEMAKDLMRVGCNVIAIGDNQKKRKSYGWNGLPVINAYDELLKNERVLIINTTTNTTQTVDNALIGAGVDVDRIYHFYMKSPYHYYQALDRRYYPEELRKIFYREFGNYELFDTMGYDEACKQVSQRMVKKYYLDRWLFIA